MYIWPHTVAGRNPANQLRLVVDPIISRVSYIPGGTGFLNHQQYQKNISSPVINGSTPSPIRSKTTKEGKASHLLALKIGRRRRHLRDKNDTIDMCLHKWNVILPAETHWDYPLENLEGRFFVKENVVKSVVLW